MRTFGCARLFWTMALLSAWGCAKGKVETRGQLMLAVTTDLQPPKDFDRVRVQVLSFGSTQFDNEYKVGKGDLTLPATLGLVVGKDPSEPATIRVTASLGKEARMVREILTTVPEHRVARLTVPVEWLCLDQVETADDGSVVSSCDDGRTCVAGECVSTEVDSSELPDFRVEDVFGGGDGSGNGSCFDTVGCFASGYVTDIDLQACSIAVDSSADSDQVSLALVRPPESDGICGPDACLVPLDADVGTDGGGWSEKNGEIELPKAVCDRLQAGDILGVAVTTACQAKTSSEPTCGEWSSVSTEAGTSDAAAPKMEGMAGAAGNAGQAGESGEAGSSGSSEAGSSGESASGSAGEAGSSGSAGLNETGGAAGTAAETGGVTMGGANTGGTTDAGASGEVSAGGGSMPSAGSSPGGETSVGGAAGTAGDGSAGASATDACSQTASLSDGTSHCVSTGQGASADGQSWSLWSSGTGACMTTYSVPGFSASWQNSGDVLARLGLNWGTSGKSFDQYGSIVAEFNEIKTGTGGGYSYIGAYGWTQNPCVEYYIVDDSYDSPINPGGSAIYQGSVTIDGGTYDLYTLDVIGSGTQACASVSNWTQYYSVRQQTRTCGQITISEHFQAWSTYGMTLGNLSEASVFVEVGGGIGSVDFTYATVTAENN